MFLIMQLFMFSYVVEVVILSLFHFHWPYNLPRVVYLLVIRCKYYIGVDVASYACAFLNSASSLITSSCIQLHKTNIIIYISII